MPDNDLDTMSFDITPMVHDLARQVLERGAVDEITAFLAANGHLAEYTRTAKAEALEEAADAMDADPEFRDPLRLKSDWLRNRAHQITEEA